MLQILQAEFIPFQETIWGMNMNLLAEFSSNLQTPPGLLKLQNQLILSKPLLFLYLWHTVKAVWFCNE